MELKGSCHCGAVKFRLVSHTPQPYMRCYCSICRKTAGGGGYAINIMGLAATLKITGRSALSVYRARIAGQAGQRSPAQRHFCGKCGSALWVQDPRWPESVYPFASAIDTPLPVPRESQHIMQNHAAPWLAVKSARRDRCFAEYPEEGILDWHVKRKLVAQ